MSIKWDEVSFMLEGSIDTRKIEPMLEAQHGRHDVRGKMAEKVFLRMNKSSRVSKETLLGSYTDISNKSAQVL